MPGQVHASLLPRVHKVRRAKPDARRSVLAFVGLISMAIGLGYGFAPPASAHNREKLSDPEDGVTLGVAPQQVTFRFKQPVDQDSLTMILIEPTGRRTPLKILRAEGDEAVGELPPLADGTYSVRWKLISSDGHAVTNRITFAVARTGTPSLADGSTSAPVDGTAPTVPAPNPAPNPAPTQTAAAPSPTPSTVSTTGPSTVSTTGPAPIPSSTAADTLPAKPLPAVASGDDPTAPDWLRWSLRFGSYLAIFALVGMWSARHFLGSVTIPDDRFVLVARIASVGIVVAALAQLGVLAMDLDPQRPLSTARRLLGFDAGAGLFARALLGGIVFVGMRKRDLAVHSRGLAEQTRRWPDPLASAIAVALLATWSYAGHAKSQRWPLLGLPLDVAHHFSAATWLGCLCAVYFFRPERGLDRSYVRLIVRLSVVAFVSVAVVVATGVLQSLRLAGLDSVRLQGRHSALLVIKIGLVAVMLLFANANRRRVKRLAREISTLAALRRFIVCELVTGIGVVALTSSLVVASPTALRWPNPTLRSGPLSSCESCGEAAEREIRT